MSMTTTDNRILACPQCRKRTTWQGNPSRPFCSERCRLIDLANWASGSYAIPSDERPADLPEDSEQ